MSIEQPDFLLSPRQHYKDQDEYIQGTDMAPNDKQVIFQTTNPPLPLEYPFPDSTKSSSKIVVLKAKDQ